MTQIFWLLSFLLPFQLALHLNELTPLIYGFRIDYLIPTIYVTDIVVIWLIVVWLKTTKFKIKAKYVVYGIAYIAFVVFNILYSTYYIPAIYKWLKVTELILLATIIKSCKDIKPFNHFILPLSYSVLIVCILALWQYFVNGSVGGLFYLLGERALSFSDPGISPHPYSTFSHPNSLAGFLLVYLFLIVKNKLKFNKNYFYVLLFLIISVLLLTNSLNVYIAAVLSIFLIKFKISIKILISIILIVSLLMPFTKTFSLIDQSIVDRVKLAKASVEIIKSSPLVGVGLNNFISNLVNTNFFFENSWQLQPVHNIFLLVLSEIGVLGFLFFCSLFFLSPITYYLLPVLLTGLFDHYWLTLQQNMLLMTMIIGFSFDRLKIWKNK